MKFILPSHLHYRKFIKESRGSNYIPYAQRSLDEIKRDSAQTHLLHAPQFNWSWKDSRTDPINVKFHMRSTHIKLGCLHEFRIYVPVPPYFPTTLSRPLRSRQPLASTCQSNLHKVLFRELNRVSYKARMNLLCFVPFFFWSDHIRLGGVCNLLDATILATI